MSKRLRAWRLSRARAARAEKPAAPADSIEKFAGEAHDLDAVRKSVEDAAAVSAGLWLSYLFALFYIAIAAGAVTHKDLLLENPVKLPFLNVELPLVAFFFLAPILFIVSHAYTLMHFVMLGAKVGVFDAELRAQLADAPETRDGLRRQLPSNIFVQFLAGPRDLRDGGLGWLLKAIAWITLVIGPVFLLLLIQVQFLPYHLEWVTWVQRVAVLADVILLWLLWPGVLNGRSDIKWPPLRRHPVLTLASLVSIGFAFTTATFPGERMEDWIGRRQWVRDLKLTSVHDLLFNGEVDEVTRRRKSLFSNTLVLPAFDGLEAAKIDDPKKLDSVKQTLVLRGRHLESAVFNNSDLRKADLGDAYLQGASFYQAKLQGAWFYKAKLQAAVFRQAKLQCASLDNARLEAASLDNAELQGAWLNEANFQGASLRDAQLQGAYLRGAQLQGASLVFGDGLKQSALSKDKIAALKVTIIKETPDGENRENALNRIENPDNSLEGSAEETLNKEGRSVEDETAHRSALADHLKSLACSGDENAPYIVRGLVANGRIEDTGTQAPSLAAAILKPDCPVSAALSEADNAALKRIAKEASGAH